MLLLLLGFCTAGNGPYSKIPESIDQVCLDYPMFLKSSGSEIFTIPSKLSCINGLQLPCLANQMEINKHALFTAINAQFENRTLKYNQCQQIKLEKLELEKNIVNLNTQIRAFSSRFKNDHDSREILINLIGTIQREEPNRFYFLYNCHGDPSSDSICFWNHIPKVGEVHFKHWYFHGTPGFPRKTTIALLRKFSMASFSLSAAVYHKQPYEKHLSRFLGSIIHDLGLHKHKKDLISTIHEIGGIFICLPSLCSCRKLDKILCSVS